MSGSRAGSVASSVPGTASSRTVTWAWGRGKAGGLSFTSVSLTEIQAVSRCRGEEYWAAKKEEEEEEGSVEEEEEKEMEEEEEEEEEEDKYAKEDELD
ncbi:hypothetical protein E2C01_066912 [Portunus trituberculatus]|uniref:Uncharacterized protein n=1 Tax=Portunus trituberculatus TaxID=210409 RepID=A0A5B7HJH1_PORTR|nr:hypothetical protein [Portunus trituberculatus]